MISARNGAFLSFSESRGVCPSGSSKAMHYLNDPEYKYWLTRKDIQVVTQVNESYRVASLEEEQVRKYFEKGKRNDPKAEWLSASDIVDILSEILTVRLAYGAKIRVGKAMMAMKCDSKWVRGNHLYCVRRLNVSENEQTEISLEQTK